jgi:hypothetical protein
VNESSVLKCSDIRPVVIDGLLRRYNISSAWVAAGLPLTGSYWGEPEAGIIGQHVYLSLATPVHSLLHEVCHIICMTPERRRTLHGNAGSDDLEESATCYLQVLLADHLPCVGRQRLMQDMDAWGYSSRAGSTRRWFDDDAEDAQAWLMRENLVTAVDEPVFRLRE